MKNRHVMSPSIEFETLHVLDNLREIFVFRKNAKYEDKNRIVSIFHGQIAAFIGINNIIAVAAFFHSARLIFLQKERASISSRKNYFNPMTNPVGAYARVPGLLDMLSRWKIGDWSHR